MTSQIKKGDLVKMKYIMWWMLQSRKYFVREPALVLKVDYNCVELLLSDGRFIRNLMEHWEAVDERS